MKKRRERTGHKISKALKKGVRKKRRMSEKTRLGIPSGNTPPSGLRKELVAEGQAVTNLGRLLKDAQARAVRSTRFRTFKSGQPANRTCLVARNAVLLPLLGGAQ